MTRFRPPPTQAAAARNMVWNHRHEPTSKVLRIAADRRGMRSFPFYSTAAPYYPMMVTLIFYLSDEMGGTLDLGFLPLPLCSSSPARWGTELKKSSPNSFAKGKFSCSRGSWKVKDPPIPSTLLPRAVQGHRRKYSLKAPHRSARLLSCSRQLRGLLSRTV